MSESRVDTVLWGWNPPLYGWAAVALCSNPTKAEKAFRKRMGFRIEEVPEGERPSSNLYEGRWHVHRFIAPKHIRDERVYVWGMKPGSVRIEMWRKQVTEDGSTFYIEVLVVAWKPLSPLAEVGVSGEFAQVMSIRKTQGVWGMPGQAELDQVDKWAKFMGYKFDLDEHHFSHAIYPSVGGAYVSSL